MKLSNCFNFSSCAISMIRAYLTGQSQCVTSDSARITSGVPVPKGSVLGPLLFCLFMNDVSEVMKHCKYHIYADDVQLYISSKYDVMGDCVVRLNDDLARIHRWGISNSLLLNPNKTKTMFICRSRAAVVPSPVVVAGVTIPYSSKVCDLKMTLNDRLTFDDHRNDLCSKVYYSLQNLWSASEYISSELKLRLIKALVIPHSSYLVMSCLEWLILLVCADLRSLSTILYRLFMACGITITSLNIAEIFWAAVFLNTMYSGLITCALRRLRPLIRLISMRIFSLTLTVCCV
jgi:hypothetical protein